MILWYLSYETLHIHSISAFNHCIISKYVIEPMDLVRTYNSEFDPYRKWWTITWWNRRRKTRISCIFCQTCINYDSKIEWTISISSCYSLVNAYHWSMPTWSKYRSQSTTSNKLKLIWMYSPIHWIHSCVSFMFYRCCFVLFCFFVGDSMTLNKHQRSLELFRHWTLFNKIAILIQFIHLWFTLFLSF